MVGAVLQPEIGDRVGSKERLHFVFLDGELQQIAGISAPVDVLVGIDAQLGKLDRKEVLVGAGKIADRHDLALEIGKLLHTRIHA